MDSKTPSLELVWIINGFTEVFPEYLLGYPLERKIDFCIDLHLDTKTIDVSILCIIYIS